MRVTSIPAEAHGLLLAKSKKKSQFAFCQRGLKAVLLCDVYDIHPCNRAASVHTRCKLTTSSGLRWLIDWVLRLIDLTQSLQLHFRYGSPLSDVVDLQLRCRGGSSTHMLHHTFFCDFFRLLLKSSNKACKSF